ncbi:MAG: hydroxyacylglutathione hydrolase [Parvularculales bacterium]
MAQLDIHQFPCLDDNYGYLVHEGTSGVTAAIDTPDANVIMAELDKKGWSLTHILNTHHHGDHTGGNLALKEATGCVIVGPRADEGRIPAIDHGVGDGDGVEFGSAQAQVFDVPGHTRGHIAYYFSESGVAFVGDTLFALGCGRLFEGTPAQMWTSLQKLMALPDETVIYCAHEYTQANARFALTVDPQNEALRMRAQEIDVLRSENRPTVPTTLALEKATNPFLRPDSTAIQDMLGMRGDDVVAVFAEIRHRKDNY